MADPDEVAALAISAEMGIEPGAPMTAEQHAEFARRFGEVAQEPLAYRLAAPDGRELRDFLKANATVVAPGETLVIRAPGLTPMAISEVSRWLNGTDDEGKPWFPFRAVVVPGDGFAVVEQGQLKEALRDLVREEIFRERADRAGFMKDVRTDVTRDETGSAYRLTHLPTGITASAPTADEALRDLGTELAARGKISVNDARKALGLPTWPVPEFDEAREIPR